MILLILNLFLQVLSIVIFVLLGLAYFTLVERKVIAAVQRRRGPNVVGFVGLLQPLADGAKLLFKETIFPSSANIIIFLLAPIFTFVLSLLSWSVIPFNFESVFFDFNLGVLLVFAITSLEVYGIIMAGWSSNSKYAFLGSLRSTAQMISYEVSIGLILMSILLLTGSFNLTEIVLAQKSNFYFIPLFPIFLIFFVSALAETNRHPFDLPEAEAELVSGYNVEYSSIGFALFFLAEYGNMLFMSVLSSIFFFGGWLPLLNFFPFTLIPGGVWFGLKVLFFVLLFILSRACLPRFRYDQLMRLGWKVFLPFSLGWLIFFSSFLISFDGLPIIS
jgi:NADH-quinone oxidoreductase subunit H